MNKDYFDTKSNIIKCIAVAYKYNSITVDIIVNKKGKRKKKN